MRKPSWRTPYCWMIGLVLLAVTGCSAGPVSGPHNQVAPDHEDVGQWEPVDVGAVASCHVLDRMADPSSLVPSDGLASVRLPCLRPGPDIDVAQLRGRPVLLNAWASWCGPCRDEMPFLTAAHQRFGDQIQFVGLNTADAPPTAADFLEEFQVRYPQLADPNSRLLDHLRVPGLPVTLILGANGAVLHKHIGPLERDELDTLLTDVARSK